MDYVYYGSIKISVIYYIIAIAIGVALAVFTHCRLHRLGAVWAGVRAIAAGALAAYIFLVFSSTVLARPDYGFRDYRLIPFWSYAAIARGYRILITENIANIVMLMPIGFLLPIAARVKAGRVILAGLIFSLAIESLQLNLDRGLFEFDDIIHNAAGCLIGYAAFVFIKKILSRIRER